MSVEYHFIDCPRCSDVKHGAVCQPQIWIWLRLRMETALQEKVVSNCSFIFSMHFYVVSQLAIAL